MERINILNKIGFLTDEERKEPLEHGCEYVTFKTCLDLSEPIEVRSHAGFDVSLERYSNDVASFISFWNHFVAKDLNGFSGFHNVEWVLKDFKVV